MTPSMNIGVVWKARQPVFQPVRVRTMLYTVLIVAHRRSDGR